MVLHDLRYAVRMVTRNPLVSLATVLVLALGIGANTTLFGVIHAVLLRPLPYHEPERLVRIWEQHPQRGIDRERVAPGNLADWRELNHVFEGIGFWGAWRFAYDFVLAGPEGPEHVRGAFVSANLFPLLGVRPLLGRGFEPQEDQRERSAVVILSHALWQRRYAGSPDVVGRKLSIDRYTLRDFTIVGVMPPQFDFPERAEMWLPAGWMGLEMERRDAAWLMALGRLRPGVTLQTAETELRALQQRIARDDGDISPSIVMMTLQDATSGSLRLTLLVLQGTVLFVLFIACANVANLLLANATARQRELAVRSALGAGRRRLVAQLLTESILRASIAGALGIALAIAGMAVVRRVGPHTIPRLAETGINAPVLAFTLGLLAIVALLFGLAPAVDLVRGNLTDRLREGARAATAGVRATRVRNTLMVAEVALTLMLLVGAGLLIQSLYRLQRVDLGIRSERLLTATVDMMGSSYTVAAGAGSSARRVFTKRLLDRLNTLPGVTGAAAVDVLPPEDRSLWSSIAIEGRAVQSDAELPVVMIRAVSPSYFDVMGIPLKSGRTFGDVDTEAGPRVAIVNDAFARRYFPKGDAVGKRLDLAGGARQPGDTRPIVYHQIVGVAGDVHNIGVSAEPRPEVYKPYFQWPWYKAVLVLRSNQDPSSVAGMLRREVQALRPDQLVINVRPMDEVLGEMYAQPRFRTLLIGLFGVVALVLAAIGIYGVLDYAVAQRTHEVGVRLALGSSGPNVFRLVVGQGLRLVALGVGLGLVGAAFIGRALSALLFGVSPLDPPTFLGSALFLAGVACLAMFVPARRAAHVNPIVALRHE